MEEKKVAVIRSTGLKSIESLPLEKTEEEKTSERQKICAVVHSVLGSLLSLPPSYEVSFVVGNKTTIFQIEIQQKDYGRLLGTKGRNINALRTLVTSMSANSGFRAIVEVKNEDQFFRSGNTP